MNRRCPQCNSKLKIYDISSQSLDLNGLNLKEKTMVKQNEYVHYMCGKCPCFFLFLKSKVFIWVYKDFIWKEIKEKVTFT